MIMQVKVLKKNQGPIQREAIRKYGATSSKKKSIDQIRSIDDVANEFIALGIKAKRRIRREKKKAKLARQKSKQQNRTNVQAEYVPAIQKGLEIMASASTFPIQTKAEKSVKASSMGKGEKGIKILARRKSRTTKWRHGRTGSFSGPA